MYRAQYGAHIKGYRMADSQRKVWKSFPGSEPAELPAGLPAGCQLVYRFGAPIPERLCWVAVLVPSDLRAWLSRGLPSER